jgi:endogenous inhibitor of DNA gyrase (YacG/DUF329 family)
MITKKCPSCAKKIDKKFNYCPWCGAGIKNVKEKDNYGILGKNDNIDSNLFSQEIKLPFGMDKMVNSLMKQIEKEMGNETPHKFNIKIQTGFPQKEKKDFETKNIEKFNISTEEKERRNKLPKKTATSKVKRLSDSIIYEIEIDEIKDRSQVNILKLENGFEIKIFGKKFCFVKDIHLDMKLIGYKISKDKVLVEFKE